MQQVFGSMLAAASRRLLLLSSSCAASLRPAVNSFHVSASEPETLFHEVRCKDSGNVRRIAYHKTSGPRTHGLVYIPGFMAHKGGGKAVSLHSFCQKYGFSYLRYDPSGLGETEGVNIMDTKFSLWLDDAKEILLNTTDGPQIVVCSSMGCWLISHLVQAYPEKFAAILMLAPAINFHHQYAKVLKAQLTPKLLQKYEEGGVVSLYRPDYGEFPLTKAHFEDMEKFTLTREPDQIPVPIPVRIIHGVKDKDVPHTESLALLHSLKTDDVRLTYLKHAGHTLTDDDSLDVIYDAILKLASQVEPKANQ